jgi:hypothetical protein
MRWIRYLLRLVVAVLLLVDLQLLVRFVAPQDDHFFKPTATDWLLTGLTCTLFLCVQGFIVWLDIRLGRRGRGREPGAVRP